MIIFYSLRFETPPIWRARSAYSYPKEQGSPIIPPGIVFSLRRLLRLAGLRCRHSKLPPHREQIAQSQSQSYFKTDGSLPISSSWRQANWDSRPVFFGWKKTNFSLWISLYSLRKDSKDNTTSNPSSIVPSRVHCCGKVFIGRHLGTPVSSGPTIQVFQLPYHNVLRNREPIKLYAYVFIALSRKNLE
jgi:hypothetical protein